jgi:hypothetical protein
MTKSRDCNWSIVLKFALIIVTSAYIAGIVGGVKSQVVKFRSREVVRTVENRIVGNGTAGGVKMVTRMRVG